MKKFVVAYHGNPAFASPQDGANHMTAWKAWMNGLGNAVVDAGLPLGPSKTIHPDQSVTDDGGPNPLAGITILQAATMEDAITMVQGCPHLSAGGSIELAPAKEMDMS